MKKNNIILTGIGIISAFVLITAFKKKSNAANNEITGGQDIYDKTINIKPYAYYNVKEKISKTLKLRIIADYYLRKFSISYSLIPLNGIGVQGAILDKKIYDIKNTQYHKIDDDLSIEYDFNSEPSILNISINSRVYGSLGLLSIDYLNSKLNPFFRN